MMIKMREAQTVTYSKTGRIIKIVDQDGNEKIPKWKKEKDTKEESKNL